MNKLKKLMKKLLNFRYGYVTRNPVITDPEELRKELLYYQDTDSFKILSPEEKREALLRYQEEVLKICRFYKEESNGKKED